MTAIVGIKASDGIVIGTDSSATFGDGRLRTMEQSCKKLFIIHNKVILTGTGQIGLGQRFNAQLENAFRDKEVLRKSAIEIGKHICQLGINDFASTKAAQGQFGALVAFPAEDGKELTLCEFALQDFQPELKTKDICYCSMGSSQPITDPFLAFIRDVFWGDKVPNLQDATFAVHWTLQHAIQTNPGGVNGPANIVVMERQNGKPTARLLSQSDLDQHSQNLEAAKEYFRKYPSHLTKAVEDVPKV